MELFQIDDNGQLFISPALDCWDVPALHGIDVVVDLEGGLDACIPTASNQCVYVYFPIDDDDQQLPNLAKLRAIARLAASLITEGHRVLAHCGMGYNRSALMAGLVLAELGMPGPDAVSRIKQRRPGALYNDMFAAFVESHRRTAGCDVVTDSDLVVVRTFSNIFDAQLAKSALEAAEIRSMIRADDAGGMRPHLWQAGIELIVRAEDAQRATEILGIDAA
jgi:hypothetical protein